MDDSIQAKRWRSAMIEKGHKPKLDEGGVLDFFVQNVDIHNGPGCTACGWDCCWHCDTIGDIPKCTGKEAAA